MFSGIELDLSLSLHNQGILEQEHVTLVHRGEESESATPRRTGSRKRSGSIKSKEEVSGKL